MVGSIMRPMETTVAGLEPEMAPKNMEPVTVVMASPPRIGPTSSMATRRMRWDRPPVLIRLPARMNSGIAISGKLSRPENMR